MQFGKSVEQTAAREVVEETGPRVTNLRFLTAINEYVLEEC